MSSAHSVRPKELVVREGQKLVAIEDIENGSPITRYRVENIVEVDSEVNVERRRKALAAIGAWADLDWDDLEESLYRIRHDSVPTPPIDLDELI